MKKTLIALTLVASLVAGSAMANQGGQTNSRGKHSSVPQAVQTLVGATAVAAEFSTASDGYAFLKDHYKLNASAVDAMSGLLTTVNGDPVRQATAANAGKVLVSFDSLPTMKAPYGHQQAAEGELTLSR